MGAGASTIPIQIDKETFRMLSGGGAANDALFDAHSVDGLMARDKLIELSRSHARDCLLSHDLGTDQYGRDNHARVARINAALRARGLTTWFDDEREPVRDDVVVSTATTQEQEELFVRRALSRTLVCFLTRAYLEDHTHVELCTQSTHAVIAVVMEELVRDPAAWPASVATALRDYKVIDFVDDEQFDETVDALCERIVSLSRTTTQQQEEDLQASCAPDCSLPTNNSKCGLLAEEKEKGKDKKESSTVEEEEKEKFDREFRAVVSEIKSHPEVWINVKKDLRQVARRLHSLDVPPMRLIHGETIARLQRVPRSSELDEQGRPYWVTLDDMLEKWRPRPGVENPIVAFASHRWVGGAPDDARNAKARAIAQFTRYHRTVYKRDSYWWVDWTCMDQSDVGPHVAALPLYIAAAEEVIAFFSPSCDYRDRGWIRCELALSATLNSPRGWRVTPISDDESARAAALEDSAEFVTINDPGKGRCFFESDLFYTRTLGELAVELWPIAYERNWSASENYREWPGVNPTLVFGESQVYTWNMNAHMGRPSF